MKNKGFTLIEVLVVLSLLALIAILAYNFFGNSMREAAAKEAAVKIRRDFAVIENAVEKYRLKIGQHPGGSGPTVPFNAIFAQTDLHSKPDLDDKLERSGCSVTTGPAGDGYALNPANLTDSRTVTADYYAYISCLTEEVCQSFNDQYTSRGVGAAIPTTFATLFADGGMVCWGTDASTTSYTATFAIENN